MEHSIRPYPIDQRASRAGRAQISTIGDNGAVDFLSVLSVRVNFDARASQRSDRLPTDKS
jgi:hypothetical protein